MKNSLCIFILLSLLSLNAYAKKFDITSSVSLVGMSMDYREYDTDGVLVDSEESDFSQLIGVEMNVGFIVDKEVSAYSQVNINLMLLKGETTYKGSYLYSGLGYGSVVSTTKNAITDMDISFKRTNIISNAFEINYGIGIGYRSWERELSSYQLETYEWYSFRPMAGMDFAVNEKFHIGASLEYQFGINPTMKESVYGLDFTLGGADIIELSLPVNYKYSENVNIFFEATFQKQTIKKSAVEYYGSTGYYEPDSTANNQYLKLGLAYKF